MRFKQPGSLAYGGTSGLLSIRHHYFYLSVEYLPHGSQEVRDECSHVKLTSNSGSSSNIPQHSSVVRRFACSPQMLQRIRLLKDLRGWLRTVAGWIPNIGSAGCGVHDAVLLRLFELLVSS